MVSPVASATRAGVTFAAKTDARPAGAPISLRPDLAQTAGGAISAFAPLPPQRPVALTVAALTDIPMPPMRPATFEAGTAVAADSGDRPTSLAGPAPLVPLDHPVPPSRSSVFPSAALVSEQVDGMPTGSLRAGGGSDIRTSERERLSALFESAAMVPARLPRAEVKVASVRAGFPAPAHGELVAPPAPAAGHFLKADQNSSPNHFTGKAIVAPTSVGFTLRR
jgi:hypothetical protein